MEPHEFVRRKGAEVVSEELFGDWVVRWLYAPGREHSGIVFSALASRRLTNLLALLNYDLPWASRLLGNRGFLERCGVDLGECLDPAALRTPRALFERQIRYWECRPLPDDPSWVVSPADARVLVGSLLETSALWIKRKFFSLEELLGPAQTRWIQRFAGGDFAIFRLTPDLYHYNHAPVAGRVVDFYAVDGGHHACNPTALIELPTPHSKNRRVVTLIDSDVPGGSAAGLVAMIEVVALMIGDVQQCASAVRYDRPHALRAGMFLERGQPKSLFRPGSSSVVLLFEPGRARFCDDLIENRLRSRARSRFSAAFAQPLVETDVRVRSPLARRAP